MRSARIPDITLAAAALAAALFAGGCKPSPVSQDVPADHGAPLARKAATQASNAHLVPVSGPTGSVAGTVTLTGKLPARIEIDTSMDPACGLSHTPLSTEQYVVNKGKLGNVFVYIKSGPPAAMNAAPISSAPAVLDQTACRYIPHVLGVVEGGTVEFRNSDPTMHNVHTMPTTVGNQTIDITMGPHGAPQTRQMEKPENLIPVRCNNHPWMNAFIDVAPTPFFQVTGPDGTFDLKGLPPGDYVLGAVQEKLGEKTANVFIAAGQSAKVDFTYAMSR